MHRAVRGEVFSAPYGCAKRCTDGVAVGIAKCGTQCNTDGISHCRTDFNTDGSSKRHAIRGPNNSSYNFPNGYPI